MEDSDLAWERFGRTDAYFGVVSQDRFRHAGVPGQARRDFFASGEAYIDSLIGILESGLVQEFSPRRGLDFGCGVGRLVLPLAKRCEAVVGIDVSESMLAEARKNCDEAGLTNIELLSSDDQLSQLSGSFDFIHSFIVFQHIAPRRGEALVQKLLGMLEDGGIGALHFTYGNRMPMRDRMIRLIRERVPLAHNVSNLFRGRPWGYPHMQMNEYNLNRLADMLEQNGCHQIMLRFSNHGGHRGAMLIFRKQALAPL